MDSHVHDHESCCAPVNNSSLHQTLLEMEFERGIWYAAQHNDLERVEALMKKGISANVEDSVGYTALHYAARNGHYKVCETLLLNGADVNACTRSGRATALHRAATQGHASIVELLVRFGANPNLKDADGCTALHRGLASARVPVCEFLIPRTDLSSVDNAGRSVKQLAEEYCSDVLPLFDNPSQ